MTDAEAYCYILRRIIKLAADREHSQLRAIQQAATARRPKLVVIEGGKDG